jgi:photosynthetic reaction center H subunit
MKLGQITSYIDVAQVTLYVFWVFFACLVYYLRREDRREGYPLMIDPTNQLKNPKDILIPTPKTFLLQHGGGSVKVPNGKHDARDPKAKKIGGWPGAPYEPVGDPMLAEVGPGAYAERADKPDLSHDGKPKIVPLRGATTYKVDSRDPDPRGMTVVGGDKATAGVVTDLWVDRSEALIRYLEVEITGTPESNKVLLPMNFAKVNKTRGVIEVYALFVEHFANVPRLATPDKVTLLEEDKICAYYGAGTLYAHPGRSEPLL